MILVKSKLDKSSVHGIGLFAKEFIAKGTLVWKFDERFELVLSKEELAKLSPAAKEQFLNYAYISKKTGRYILCFDDSRFFNHSLSANVKCEVPENPDSDDDLVCFAVRDIKPKEELTCDYREFDDAPSDVIL